MHKNHVLENLRGLKKTVQRPILIWEKIQLAYHKILHSFLWTR